MKFKTITCTVVKRIKRERSQSIRIAHIFGEEHNPETGITRTVQYKDCWIPFEWTTKQGKIKTLSFTDATPEELQVWNPYTKQTEMHVKRFTFYIPEWLHGNLKPWRTQVTEQLDLFENDDDPLTIIEEQDESRTMFSIERQRDLRGSQYMMFDAPINFSIEEEIQNEFDNYSYGLE